MANNYYTLGNTGVYEFVEKKSRFIGQALPVSSEEEALAFIRQVKENHKAASHNCFAYIIGANAGLMRYQDDGEPQGTAGIPILEVLKKNQLVNCALVVTRYFGGVLLGAGGLTRAYTAGAAGAVRDAGIVEAQSSQRLEVRIPYAYWDSVNHHLQGMPVCEVTPEYADAVTLRMIVREADAQAVSERITNLIDGSAAVNLSEPFHHLWERTESPEHQQDE